MKQNSKKLKKIVIIVVLVVVGYLLLPIKQSCRVPGYTCAYLGDDGEVCYVYDLQPVFISVLEGCLGKDLPISFGWGEECYKN